MRENTVMPLNPDNRVASKIIVLIAFTRYKFPLKTRTNRLFVALGVFGDSMKSMFSWHPYS